jgi:hypothetical protein
METAPAKVLAEDSRRYLHKLETAAASVSKNTIASDPARAGQHNKQENAYAPSSVAQ